jgi:precorrin-6B methylase 2
MGKQTRIIDDSLEALLYDWHNSLKLKRQNEDINYYKEFVLANKLKKILIIGAGTGRIAMPLSSVCDVTALDKSLGRLKRIIINSNIHIEHCDIIDFHKKEEYDCIIIPYSTFQCIYPTKKIIDMLLIIHALLSPKGFLIIDLSTHFNDDVECDWEKVAEGFSPELDAHIIEYNKIVRYKNYILLIKSFEINNEYYQCDEIWYNYDYDYVFNVLSQTGFKISNIRNGYGNGKSEHRRIITSNLI